MGAKSGLAHFGRINLDRLRYSVVNRLNSLELYQRVGIVMNVFRVGRVLLACICGNWIACSIACSIALVSSASNAVADQIPLVARVEKQPLVAATSRLVEAMKAAGSPFSDELVAALGAAYKLDDVAASRAIQQLLDPLCIAAVNINAESRVKVQEGECKKELIQNGWRAFLVKVHNQAAHLPRAGG